MAQDVAIAPASREAEAFRRYHDNSVCQYKDASGSVHSWLSLRTGVDGNDTLGCSLCLRLLDLIDSKRIAAKLSPHYRRWRKGLVTGEYQVGKYMCLTSVPYTFQKHVRCRAHDVALNYLVRPSDQVQDSIHTPAADRGRLKNLFLAVYNTLRQGHSYSAFLSSIRVSRLQGALLIQHHDSLTVFRETKDLIVAGLRQRARAEIRASASPVFGLFIDEKGGFLVLLVSLIDAAGNAKISFLAYRDLTGFDSFGIVTIIREVLVECDVDLQNLWVFTADRASAMGTREALSPCEKNVASRLISSAKYNLLVPHCAPHWLQLCAVDAFGEEPYFRNQERVINSLAKFIRDAPGTIPALVFWSDVCVADMLTNLGTSKVPWLSLLKPLEKIHTSYTTVLAFLCFFFNIENDREKRKVTQRVFKTMATWEWRLTVACQVDILQMCLACKNRVEKDISPARVQEALHCHLSNELQLYCQRNFVLARGFVDASSDGPTEAEKTLSKLAHGSVLQVQYEHIDGHKINQAIELECLNRDEIKEVFKRIGRFAIKAKEGLLKGFANHTFLSKFDICEPAWDFNHEVLEAAAGEFAEFLPCDRNVLFVELRRVFACRSRILEQTPDLQQGEAARLWQQVVLALKEENDLKNAKRLINIFLCHRTTSTTYQRAFTMIETLKRNLEEENDRQLYEQYLTCMLCTEDLNDVYHNGFLDSILQQYLSSELRKQQERAQRQRKQWNHETGFSDAKKRHLHLCRTKSARGDFCEPRYGMEASASCQEGVAPDAPVAQIMLQTPPSTKKLRRALSASSSQ